MKGKIYRDKIDEQEKRMNIGYVLCDSLCRYVLLLSNFFWFIYIQIWFRVCKRLLFGYKYLLTSSLARTIIVTIITTLLSGIYICMGYFLCGYAFCVPVLCTVAQGCMSSRYSYIKGHLLRSLCLFMWSSIV